MNKARNVIAFDSLENSCFWILRLPDGTSWARDLLQHDVRNRREVLQLSLHGRLHDGGLAAGALLQQELRNFCRSTLSSPSEDKLT